MSDLPNDTSVDEFRKREKEFTYNIKRLENFDDENHPNRDRFEVENLCYECDWRTHKIYDKNIQRKYRRCQLANNMHMLEEWSKKTLQNM